MIFDINLIVIPFETCDPLEHYHGTATYDQCCPHIILGRDIHDVYHPITYEDRSVLIAYETDFVQKLLSLKNKVDHGTQLPNSVMTPTKN